MGISWDTISYLELGAGPLKAAAGGNGLKNLLRRSAVRKAGLIVVGITVGVPRIIERLESLRFLLRSSLITSWANRSSNSIRVRALFFFGPVGPHVVEEVPCGLFSASVVRSWFQLRSCGLNSCAIGHHIRISNGGPDYSFYRTCI